MEDKYYSQNENELATFEQRGKGTIDLALENPNLFRFLYISGKTAENVLIPYHPVSVSVFLHRIPDTRSIYPLLLLSSDLSPPDKSHKVLSFTPKPFKYVIPVL